MMSETGEYYQRHPSEQLLHPIIVVPCQPNWLFGAKATY